MLQLLRFGAPRPAFLTAFGLATVAFTACVGSEAVAAGEVTAVSGWLSPELLRALDDGVGRLSVLVRLGFERQPAAMLATAGAAAVPLMAILAALLRFAGRISQRAGSRDDRSRHAVSGEPYASGAAWIEIENRREGRMEIGELTRIGRSEDCDLALGDASVDHTHALIRRTSDCEFIIIDVSANDGSGMTINGQRMRQGTLRDGDRIELGAARVVFRQALMAGCGEMAVAA